MLAVSFRLHQSTLCAPAASQDRTSPAANTAPTGVHPVVVEPFDTEVSPITTAALGSRLGELLPDRRLQRRDLQQRVQDLESDGLAPPVAPENVNG